MVSAGQVPDAWRQHHFSVWAVTLAGSDLVFLYGNLMDFVRPLMPGNLRSGIVASTRTRYSVRVILDLDPNFPPASRIVERIRIADQSAVGRSEIRMAVALNPS